MTDNREMGQLSPELLNKYESLKEYLKSLHSVAVAFSSGVDSTFLLYAAREALGDAVIAVTARFRFGNWKKQKSIAANRESGILYANPRNLRLKGSPRIPRTGAICANESCSRRFG